MRSAQRDLRLSNEQATEDLAKRLAEAYDALAQSGGPEQQAFSNVRLYLHGNLGAGKTTFSRYFLRALGVTGKIKSPSYTLVESYKVSRLQLYHFDFYRFNSFEEWQEAGFQDELLEQNSLSIVEWSEKAGATLPPADLNLYLSYINHDVRLASLKASTPQGQIWLQRLEDSYPTDAKS